MKRKISKRESSGFLYISHSKKLIIATDCGCNSEKPERKKKTLGECSEAREKMRKRITLKKKSDPGKFAIPCTVQDIEFQHALCDT